MEIIELQGRNYQAYCMNVAANVNLKRGMLLCFTPKDEWNTGEIEGIRLVIPANDFNFIADMSKNIAGRLAHDVTKSGIVLVLVDIT